MSILELQLEKGRAPTLNEIAQRLEEKGIIIWFDIVGDELTVITDKGYVLKITHNENGGFTIEEIGGGKPNKDFLKAPEPEVSYTKEPEEDTEDIVTIKVTAKESEKGINKIQFIDESGYITEKTYLEEKGEIKEEFTVSTNGIYKIKVISAAPKTVTKEIKIDNIIEPFIITPNHTKWTNEDVTLSIQWPNVSKTAIKQISIKKVGEEDNYRAYNGEEIKIGQNKTVVGARYIKEDGQETTTTLTIENIDKLKPKNFNQTVISGIGTITVNIEASHDDAEEDQNSGKSGIKEYMYKIDDGVWETMGTNKIKTINNVEVGEHVVSTKAVDNAGNEKEATNNEQKVEVKTLEGYKDEIKYEITPQEYSKEKTLTVTWPQGIQGMITKISLDGDVESAYTTYTNNPTTVKLTKNGIIYMRLEYGDNTATATLTVETIDLDGPTITISNNVSATNNELGIKILDNQSGLASVKIEKITTPDNEEYENAIKTTTTVKEYTYEGEKDEQTITQTLKATYQQYLRGYKITAIDKCGNEKIYEKKDLCIQNTQLVITTAEELKDFANAINNNGTSFEGVTVQLGANIDLLNYNWTPIGTRYNRFNGIFEGNNYTISNMRIENSTSDAVGLFSYLEKGTIQNLKLENYNISGTGASIGSLVGSCNGGKIHNVKLENYNISGTGNNVGGLVGECNLCDNVGSTITKVSAKGTIEKTAGNFVGGLIGNNYEGSIQMSFSEGDIIAKNSEQVGGLVGRTNGGALTNSYSSTNVEGKNQVGGLIGWDWTFASCCYAVGKITSTGNKGGFCGYSDGVSYCYWDTQTTGIPARDDTERGTGLSTDDMKKQSSYKGFNFSTIWKIEAGSYPELR